MVNDSLIYILLVLSGISLIVAIVSLVIVIVVLKKQKEVLMVCRTKLVSSQAAASQSMSVAGNNSLQSNVEDTKKHGMIICKKCYAPISDTSTACSLCKTAVGRR